MSEKPPESQCQYVFDPDEWKAETGSVSELTAEDVNENGVWRCPHDSQPSQDYCVFHRPPTEKCESVVREALLAQIETSGESAKQFIGARFGSLDLSFSTLESADNHLIDLRHAEFTDRTTWEDAIVRQPIRLGGATFHERANFNRATFESEFYSSKARYRGRAWFNEVEFAQGGWFYKTEFGRTDFSMSRFNGKADFRQATFAKTHFREAVFEARAEFHKATFDHVMFTGVRFEDLAYFDEVTFPDRANFRHSMFEEMVSFVDLTLADSTCCIVLEDCKIAGGQLLQPENGEVLYTLEDATVGDVVLGSRESPTTLFAHYRVLNTTFDGFDFGRYRESLNATDWHLHEFDFVPGFESEASPSPSSSSSPSPSPSPGELENTYLKAKNGANTIGDTTAAAEFFRKEMLYRREQYRPQIRTGPIRGRLSAAFRWSANVLLDLTSGYGERPSRTVGASLAVVLAFAGVFSAARETQSYDHPIGSVILSLESFVGLVLGGAEPVGNPWVRLLASIEGFMGAFFIALFVFALTRSIHR